MKNKEFWIKAWNWLKENQLPFIYFAFALIVEMTAVFTVEGNAFMSRPMLMVGLLIFLVGGLLAIPSDKIRLAIGGVLLAVHTVVDLIFAALYDMTGQYFEFSLLNLRNDAVAALEKIPVNFLVFYMGLFSIVAFIVYGLRLIKSRGGKKQSFQKKSFFYYLATALAGIATLTISFVTYYPTNTNKYEEMLTGKSTSVYASYGMLGNLVGEIGVAIRGDKTTMSNSQIKSFIYDKEAKETEFFGKAKDNNVVVILSESFEWYSFMRSEQFYESPNQLNITKEQLAELYPNLTTFYNESIVATNFHSREKTDASESISILGSYPTEKYITYDYYDVEMPQTLPNVLKLLDDDIQVRSFHNGEKEFYNRETVHETFGFESLTDRRDMSAAADKLYEEQKKELMESGASDEEIEALKPVFTDHKGKYAEMNLDSEMIEICKDEMFPKDKRFYTYITSITMHGAYYNRRNLQYAYEEVEKVLGANMPDAEAEGDTEEKMSMVLLHYMVTAKEFDKAIGCMYEDLKNKGILDKTTILMFGDHNAYYNELSNYVKDIEDYDTDKKFTDMYKVPLMIRSGNLTKIVDDIWQTKFIDKFTCTADIVPTLLDLLGIKYYSNMYYGHSIFDYELVTDAEGQPLQSPGGGYVRTPVESVLYSRSYDIFVFDGIVGRSVITHLYLQEGLSAARIKQYEEEAKRLVEKIKYCDYIFKQDYFANQTNKQEFQNNLVNLQSK